jgi:RNA polymerase-binding protein DksA
MAKKKPARQTKAVPRRPSPPGRKPAAKQPLPRSRLKDLAPFKERLLAEKARLEADWAEIQERTARVGEAEVIVEASSYDSEHPADVASETFEREKDLALGENVEHLLAKVKEALAKIELGTYGICDACGKPIKRARLEAIPFATLCVECQGKMEFR